MEFLNTSFLQTASVNNSQLIMNIFNVSCNKEEGITLTPKSYNTSTFEITDAQKNRPCYRLRYRTASVTDNIRYCNMGKASA